MEPDNHYPVVIIGAGPVGVTAATLLAQYGVRSLVLDRWADPYPRPRAVHLDDEVYRIIDRLGIGAEFAAVARPGFGLRLLDPDLAVLAEFRRDPNRSRHGHPEANMFDQPELEALLRANLKRHPGATLWGGAEVTELSRVEAGRTRVTISDRGGGHAERVVDCDYLLGCDGANSMVRAHIGAVMRDLRFEQRWLVVDVDSSSDLQQWGGVHQVCDPRRAGTFMQVGDSRYRWEFRLLDGESADQFGSLGALRPLIAPWLGATPDEALRIIRVAEYTFRAQVADRWRRGNTFLLGDAAHLTPPFIGQGLCAGLRDAMNLSWKLAGVIGGHLPARVLDSYQRERKPHARAMIMLALMIGYSMTVGGRPGNVVRRLVVPRIRLVPGLARRVLDPETPPLRGGALVNRHRRGGALFNRHRRGPTGRLCPNARTTGGERLDSLLGTGFAVVTAIAPTDQQRRLIEGRRAALHYAEPGTPMAQWLAGARTRAVIVRPDFTVMAADDDLTRLCAALPAFG